MARGGSGSKGIGRSAATVAAAAGVLESPRTSRTAKPESPGSGPRNRPSAATPPTRVKRRPATVNESLRTSASTVPSGVRVSARAGHPPERARKAGQLGRTRSYSWRNWPELRIRPLLS